MSSGERKDSMKQIAQSVCRIIEEAKGNIFKRKCLQIMEVDEFPDFEKKVSSRLNNLSKRRYRRGLRIEKIEDEENSQKKTATKKSQGYSPIRKRCRRDPLKLPNTNNIPPENENAPKLETMLMDQDVQSTENDVSAFVKEALQEQTAPYYPAGSEQRNWSQRSNENVNWVIKEGDGPMNLSPSCVDVSKLCDFINGAENHQIDIDAWLTNQEDSQEKSQRSEKVNQDELVMDDFLKLDQPEVSQRVSGIDISTFSDRNKMSTIQSVVKNKGMLDDFEIVFPGSQESILNQQENGSDYREKQMTQKEQICFKLNQRIKARIQNGPASYPNQSVGVVKQTNSIKENLKNKILSSQKYLYNKVQKSEAGKAGFNFEKSSSFLTSEDFIMAEWDEPTGMKIASDGSYPPSSQYEMVSSEIQASFKKSFGVGDACVDSEDWLDEFEKDDFWGNGDAHKEKELNNVFNLETVDLFRVPN
eukprot:TCONS_00011472-protein